MKLYPFKKIISDNTSKFKKIKKSDYLQDGLYKIVDQGQDFIAGYTNNKKLINYLNTPIIIFGDHTKIFKFINFPIALGADGTKVLVVTENIAYPMYIYYYFKTLKLPSTGYSRHFKYLHLKKIPIPEKYEDQIRIATLLSRAEALIAKRKESICFLDELLKSTFLEMFGDPVRNEMGWEKKSLNELGSIDRGVSKNRPRNAPELLGGKYPLIQTGNVANSGTYITSYNQTYSEIGFKQSKLWPSGTLCITIAANIAKTGILTFDACFPDSVVGFINNNKKSNTLYVHVLFSFFQRILEKNAPQAAQKNINLEILRNLKVPKPPLSLQNKFAQIVEKVESIKSKYEASLTELENLYGSLSQRAFRGELDLSSVPIDTAVKPETIDAKLESNVPEVETTKRFSEMELLKIIKSKSGQSFNLDELWNRLDASSFEEQPQYDDVKKMIFNMLEGKNPLLSQSFDKQRKEIVLRVNV